MSSVDDASLGKHNGINMGRSLPSTLVPSETDVRSSSFTRLASLKTALENPVQICRTGEKGFLPECLFSSESLKELKLFFPKSSPMVKWIVWLLRICSADSLTSRNDWRLFQNCFYIDVEVPSCTLNLSEVLCLFSLYPFVILWGGCWPEFLLLCIWLYDFCYYYYTLQKTGECLDHTLPRL